MDKNKLKEIEYWNEFYAKKKDEYLSIPSQFCCLMATEVNKNIGIAEFGCGNARDSFFLSSCGFPVVGMDLSSEAIRINQQKSKLHKNTIFICGDVTIESDVNHVLSNARSNGKYDNIIVYSRFFLHSIDDTQETNFLNILSKKLIKNDKIYFEFRTDKDKDNRKIYENHFRRFINTDDFIKKITEYGFSIEYFLEGKGMAKFKTEDSIVARVIALKK